MSADQKTVAAGRERTGIRRVFFIRKNTDNALILAVLLLVAFGLMMVYTTSYYTAQLKIGDSSYYLTRQALISGGALAFMVFLSLFNYQWLCKFGTWPVYIASVVLMALVDFTSLGIEFNGRKRWFGIGGHSIFQPTELVKLALIMVVALLLTNLKYKIDKLGGVLLVLGVTGVPIFFVFLNNLSSSIILVAIVLVLMTIASEHKKKYLAVLLAFLAVVAVAYFLGDWLVDIGLLKRYQLERIDVWKDPEAYSLEGGWQVMQGLYAIGSGGFFGKGLGNSVQKLGFVPEAQNDMVFSILVEELGIFGAICLIALFGFLIYRILVIASNAPDRLGFFLCAGVAVHISLQVVLNIAVVTNMIPNTGVTLPFISYGGSSVLFLMSEFGLVLSVARQSVGISRKKRSLLRSLFGSGRRPEAAGQRDAGQAKKRYEQASKADNT